MKDNEGLEILTNLLLKKFGKEKLEGLLTEEWVIDKTRPPRKRPYVRDKESLLPNSIFCEYSHRHLGNPEIHEFGCVEPWAVLKALNDAGNEMSYSNWANDKFDRAAEIVFRYCAEHKIPIEFERWVEND